MELLLQLALRNVLRHARRTVLSAITIAFGVMMFIALDSLYTGMDRGAIDNMIKLTTSALQLSTKAYLADRESLPLTNGIPDVKALTESLKQDSRVMGVAPRTRFLGELSNGVRSTPIMGVVIDPAADKTVFGLAEYLTGSYLEGEEVHGMVLGHRLATELQVKLGDELTLAAQTVHGAHNADTFQIVGLLNTTDPGINNGLVLISASRAQQFLELEGLVTEVNVGLQRRVNFQDLVQDMAELKATTLQRFPDLDAETFAEQGAAFLNTSAQKRKFGLVFLGVLLLIGAVGIFNTVLMSVYERTKEIGVLRAHGMEPGQIQIMFVLEGLLIGLTGSLLGLAGGSYLTWYLVHTGLPIDLFMKDPNGMGMPIWGTLYGEWRVGSMIFGVCFGIAVASVAGWFPARQAARMTVTQALRYT